MTQRTWLFGATVTAVLMMQALPAHAGGDDTLYLYFPHTRLIESKTALIANRNFAYIDVGPGLLTTLRFGGFLFDHIHIEHGYNFAELREGNGTMLRLGLFTKPPVFIALSGGYYFDTRREYNMSFRLWPHQPQPKQWQTSIATAQIHISVLPHSTVLLTMNTGYTAYTREGTRAQIPFTFGVMYELVRFVHLKAEADFYTRQEELQNTSYYAGFALMVPYVEMELGYLHHNGYMREARFHGPYLCMAVYI